MAVVYLRPLEQSDREQFIKDNQEAFNYGAMEEFGMRDDHFKEDDQIISRETIEKSIDEGEAYRIISEGKAVGGVMIDVDAVFDRGFAERKTHAEFLHAVSSFFFSPKYFV